MEIDFEKRNDREGDEVFGSARVDVTLEAKNEGEDIDEAEELRASDDKRGSEEKISDEHDEERKFAVVLAYGHADLIEEDTDDKVGDDSGDEKADGTEKAIDEPKEGGGEPVLDSDVETEVHREGVSVVKAVSGEVAAFGEKIPDVVVEVAVGEDDDGGDGDESGENQSLGKDVAPRLVRGLGLGGVCGRAGGF